MKTYMNNEPNPYKYVVWVGGIDNYYIHYNDAKTDADEWIDKGYDDVIIEEIEETR